MIWRWFNWVCARLLIIGAILSLILGVSVGAAGHYDQGTFNIVLSGVCWKLAEYSLAESKSE